MQAVGGTTLNADEQAAPRFAPRAVALLAATAAVAVVVDQWVKHLSTENLDPGSPGNPGESVRILGGLVYLSLLRNSGAAFSFGSDFTWIFPLITLVVVGVIGWLASRLRSVPWGLSLGLVLGGALGNLMDRLFRAPGPFQGHVVDMISVFAPNGEKFAVFNIADSCLTVGVCIAVLLELTGRQRDGTRITGKETATTTPAEAVTTTPAEPDGEKS
ncbi:signal peptidase II [Actinoplanes sp. NEAU-A12]|uniref:Lipoprotein signal peptidase n=1 Tax=Actinoplanes sandaracinus TaxID=3045177 RepID=A0ABT6WXM3_9ACTN|nr:signal peptidase II [Actinoplanes sandaracinus]MDI6104493.1 signal peptidase II [Actinoplanes sandaracinus]